MTDVASTDELVKVTDLAKYEAGDPEFFVRAAEAEVRKYCGWHIAPSRATTGRFPLGQQGLIILRSLFVTDVESVEVGGRILQYPDDYTWEECGVITRRNPSWPRPGDAATVTFAHGYPETPADVAAVVLEVASKASESPGVAATDIVAGPFRVRRSVAAAFAQANKDQLANYRLRSFG